MTSSRARIVLISLLAIALLGAVTGCSRTTEKSGKGLSPVSRAASGTTSSATASDSPAPKLQSVSTTSSSGVAGGSGSAAGATGTGKAAGTVGTGKTTGTGTVKTPVTGGTGNTPVTGGTGDAGSPEAATPPAGVVTKAGMKVLIIFWNDTDSKPLKSTEILIGSSSYKPDTLGKTDQGTLGSVPYDEPVLITVYPDGRDGKKIEVPITVTKGMIANSEQDAIHVAVSDGSVRVLGNAVSNIDQVIARF